MAILGSVIKRGLKLSVFLQKRKTNPAKLQRRTLYKLLNKAEGTEFGVKYNFSMILRQFLFKRDENFYENFQKSVPIHDYNKMFNSWWHRSLAGEKNVVWPGRTKYFALSSGTSEAASKYIPVTKAMSRAFQRAGIKQILSLGNFKNLPPDTYEKGFLMLGGSTDLQAKGTHFEGDVSGINAGKIPFWFQPYYKPGKAIAQQRDWAAKLDEIVREAPNWDIGFIVGVPAWLQIVIEKTIAYHQLKTIHDIWPNLRVFAHGGVSFEPYRAGFEKLLDPAVPMIYIDTYLASEGYIAYQTRPDAEGMQLILNNGIFFEFVPFNDENFDADGEIMANPTTLMIDAVVEGTEYALLLSTCSGAWRYLIGDTVKFVNKTTSEIVITGRTKHYLSLCGEHLSVENMNKAIELSAEHFGISIREFAVAGVPDGALFAHNWYIGTDDAVSETDLQTFIDQKLCDINDDYAVERRHALKNSTVRVLPSRLFYEWMQAKGKMGGQNKFPRVLKKKMIDDWTVFLKTNGF